VPGWRGQLNVDRLKLCVLRVFVIGMLVAGCSTERTVVDQDGREIPPVSSVRVDAPAVPDSSPSLETVVGTATAVEAAERTAVPTTKVKASEAVTTEPPKVLAVTVTDPIGLTGDGVAGVEFGTEVESALEQLTAAFGKPVSDSGWGPNDTPCEGMGSQLRSVEFDGLFTLFAEGPTVYVDQPIKHFSAFVVNEGSAAGRFVFADGQLLMGRSFESLESNLPGVSRFESEIRGPTWVVGSGDSSLSGSLSSDNNVVSAQAGLLCID
jgi:hypothetical protein